MRNSFKYFLLAVLAWVIVDFTTTAAIRDPLAYYSRFMPGLLLFCLGYPLVFAVLIYGFKPSNSRLFLAMIVGSAVVEVLHPPNMFLLTPPMRLLAIPISLGHYGMVTFMPMWMAERTLMKNRKWVAATSGVWAVGVLLNILTQFGGHH